MDWAGNWNVVLLMIAAYVAVMALVRLMRERRDQLVREVQQQVEARRRLPVENQESKPKR